MHSLEGKVALVTGAARGIGRAIAECLAAAGARVVVADLDGAGARAVAAGLAGQGRQAVGLEVEVASAGSVAEAFDRAEAVFGPVTVLVNNAGIFPTSPVEAITEEEWDRVLAVNLKGPFLCTREAVRRLKGRGLAGAIISVASTAAKVARPFVAHYAASKAALVQFTKVVAIEGAPFGIRANAICPGLVETEGVMAALCTPFMQREHRAKVTRIPLARPADVREIGRAAVFLASDAASYVTGHALYVDGGYSAGQTFGELAREPGE